MEGARPMMPLEICVAEVLTRGLDDWIQAAEVASVAKLTGGQSTSSEIEALALSIIEDLVNRELMKPGGCDACARPRGPGFCKCLRRPPTLGDSAAVFSLVLQLRPQRVDPALECVCGVRA
jgi:hypothetical protein